MTEPLDRIPNNGQTPQQMPSGRLVAPNDYYGAPDVDAIDIQEYLAIFMRRRWLMLATLCVVIVLGMAWTVTRRPVYNSATQVVVATASGGVGNGNSDMPFINNLQNLMKSQSIATQVEVMQGGEVRDSAWKKCRDALTFNALAQIRVKSSSVPAYRDSLDLQRLLHDAEGIETRRAHADDSSVEIDDADIAVNDRAIAETAADEDAKPEFGNELRRLLNSGGLRAALAKTLDSDDYERLYDPLKAGFGDADEFPKWACDVASKKDADVITITGRAFTPEAAAAIATAVADAYIEKDLAKNREATREARVYAGSQMARISRKLEAANDALSVFKRKTGIVAMDSQFDKMAELMASLESAADTSEVEATAARRQVDAMESELGRQEANVEASKTIAVNPEFSALVDSIGKLTAQRAALLEEYTETAPEVIAVDGQIKDAQERMKTVARTVVTSTLQSRNPVRESLLGDYAKSVASSAASEARSRALSQALQDRRRKLGALPEQQRKLTDLVQNAALLRNTYEMLSGKYYALLLSENAMLPTGRVFSSATPPKSPAYPNRKRNAVMFVLFGAMCAAGLAVVVERLDVRLHDQNTVERLTGVATLSMIPEIPDDMPKLISEAGQNSLLLESYRILRNNISFSSIDKEAKILAMSSPGRGEGKSTTSANLAIAMAMDGKRVLLMDCDLRRPSQHKVFKVSRDIGFTNVLTGVCKVEDAIIKTHVENLWLLPSGPIPPNPSEILNSQHSREFFDSVRDMYDVIIVDCPPCTGLSDVQVVATIADALLLLVCMDRTIRPHLHMALRTLAQVDAPLIGTVINRMELRRQGYYSYYNYYYYSYDYTADDHHEKRVTSRKRRRKLPKP